MELELKIKNFVRGIIKSSIIDSTTFSMKIVEENEDKYKWYAKLDEESKKSFWDLMTNARNESLFNIFCLLDGSLVLENLSGFSDYEFLADGENIGDFLSSEYHTILEEEFPELYKLFVLGE